MSTTSLALLKGANKAALEQELADENKETPVEEEAVQEAPEGEEVTLSADDIKKMTGPEIDALLAENGVDQPDGWAKMTVPKKKAWLIAMMETGDEVVEEAEKAETPAEEPAEEDAKEPVPEPAPEPKAAKTPAKTTAKAKAAPAAEEEQKTAQPAKKSVSTGAKVGKEIVAVQTKEGDIIPPDAISDIAHELTNLKEQDARGVVHKLLEAGDQTDFKVGVVLAHIQDNGWYQPYANFKEFVQTEYGIAYRKAMYLIKIANDIISSGIPYEKVSAIGWGKLKDISSVLTVDNVDQWVEIAQKNTSLQLQEIVAQSKVQQTSLPSSATSEITSKTFKLHKDQKEVIEEALAKAKGVSGTEVDSVALEFIATEYVNTGASKAAKPNMAAVKKFIEELGAEKAVELVVEVFPDLDFALNV